MSAVSLSLSRFLVDPLLVARSAPSLHLCIIKIAFNFHHSFKFPHFLCLTIYRFVLNLSIKLNGFCSRPVFDRFIRIAFELQQQIKFLPFERRSFASFCQPMIAFYWIFFGKSLESILKKRKGFNKMKSGVGRGKLKTKRSFGNWRTFDKHASIPWTHLRLSTWRRRIWTPAGG